MISLGERDLSECVVDLGRDLGAPLRRDPPVSCSLKCHRSMIELVTGLYHRI